jgi:hypothetical protein
MRQDSAIPFRVFDALETQFTCVIKQTPSTTRELFQCALLAIHRTLCIALLRVVEQRHETEVHVKLLMAVKES